MSSSASLSLVEAVGPIFYQWIHTRGFEETTNGPNLQEREQGTPRELPAGGTHTPCHQNLWKDSKTTAYWLCCATHPNLLVFCADHTVNYEVSRTAPDMVSIASKVGDIIDIIKAIKNFQRCFTGRLEGMKELDYWARLRELRIMSLQRRRQRYLLIHAWKTYHELVPN